MLRSVLRHARLIAGIVALSTLALAVGPPASATTTDLRYQVAWGHLTVAEADVSVKEALDRYLVSSAGQTTGAIGLLFDWRGSARTEGLLDTGERRPLLHRHLGNFNGERRETQVRWQEASRPRTEVSPPPDLEEVTPVAEETVVGTADPFTALLHVIDGLRRTGRCEGEAKVWDGRRRYDLKVNHGGTVALQADRPWSYAGPAVICLLDYTRIGGFRRERPSWSTEKEDSRRAVFVAEITEGNWIPVRAEIETLLGRVTARLIADRPREQPEASPPPAVDRETRR